MEGPGLDWDTNRFERNYTPGARQKAVWFVPLTQRFDLALLVIQTHIEN